MRCSMARGGLGLLAILAAGMPAGGAATLLRMGRSMEPAAPAAALEVAPAPAPGPGAVPPAATPKPEEPPTLPPPPPPPPPLPPKIPVAGPLECELLEQAIIVDPKAHCWHAVLASNWDACMCSIPLPPSIVPQTDNLFNPYAQVIPPDPSIPTFAPQPTVPPPSNPLMPYNAPMMLPSCPFQAPCGPDGGFDCVGFDSFGFSEVNMVPYRPASRYLNSITCSYVMKPYDLFKVPDKVQAFWRMEFKHGEVLAFYDTDLTLKCTDQKFTNPWSSFCKDQVFRMKTDCGVPWSSLWKGTCKEAPPPANFTASSSLGEFCPLECGFKKHELKWPYPMAEPPAAAPAPAPLSVDRGAMSGRERVIEAPAAAGA